MGKRYFNNIKWIIRPKVFVIRRIFKISKEEWIMGRIACMGQDVLKLLNIGVPILNVQKGRIDLISQKSKNIVRTAQIVPFIYRDDIKDLILQQELLYGNMMKPPIALYMDSFSDLTDQLFLHRKKRWSFCANFSDINHTMEFKKKFEVIGLLSMDSLIEHYRFFFNLFRQRYPSVPIIFMHFPVKLDKREKFNFRYKKIKEAIDILEKEFQQFYSFTVDEEIVNWPEELIPGLEKFPYHYNKETYQNLANQIKESGVFAKFI
jgi:hypothetical protein